MERIWRWRELFPFTPVFDVHSPAKGNLSEEAGAEIFIIVFRANGPPQGKAARTM
jgi:hypothetical protein